MQQLTDYYQVSVEQLLAYEKTSAELLEERNTLELKVEERTNELALANSRLSELDRIKSNFFANLSHEIRTPLTLMLTPIESLLHNDAEKYRPPDRGFFESVYNNGIRLLGLINTLLDFSRIDAGRMKLNVHRIDIAAMLKTHIEALSSLCEVKNIRLDSKIESTDSLMYCDPEKIDKIIANLLSNAVKFTNEGGKVFISLNKTVNDGLEYIAITVSDTGIGIPSEHIENIFDRFSQVDSGSSRMFEGTGIGLALVKEYVSLHDGEITVESRDVNRYPGRHGTVFTVKMPSGREHFDGRGDVKIFETPADGAFSYFIPYAGLYEPIDEPATDKDTAPDKTPEASSDEYTDATILVVEDNKGMHNLLEQILGRRYRIIKALNGMEALSVLEHEENIPDLILSDVMMPEMDGYELTRIIRSDSRFEGIPVILLTAKAGLDMKLEGFGTGATDYIVKPFNARELVARVKSQIELKRVRDRLLRANRQLYARLEEKNKSRNTVSESAEAKIRQVIEFINENFTADISREGLAAAVEMSPDHLSRNFNRITGIRLDSYINELRINFARSELAKTEKPVITISVDAGFENLRTFNRLFRESEGVTPREFREANRGNIH